MSHPHRLEHVVRRLALLSVVGGLGFVAFVAGLELFTDTQPEPLTPVALVEVLLGGLYVLLLYTDRAQLADSSWQPSRAWYLPAFVLGASVFFAPLFVAVYFWRRRRAIGRPQAGYLSVVRAVLRSAT
jgi:hypothetical protein